MSDKRIGANKPGGIPPSGPRGPAPKTGKIDVKGNTMSVKQIAHKAVYLMKRAKPGIKGKGKGKYDKSLKQRAVSGGKTLSPVTSSAGSHEGGDGTAVPVNPGPGQIARDITDLFTKIKEGRSDEVQQAFKINANKVADFFIQNVRDHPNLIENFHQSVKNIATEASERGIRGKALIAFEEFARALQSVIDLAETGITSPSTLKFQGNADTSSASILKRTLPMTDNLIDDALEVMTQAMPTIRKELNVARRQEVHNPEFLNALFNYAVREANKVGNKDLVPIIFFGIVYGTGVYA